ncbi:T9SS type A sorting domain-containing protein [Hyunsoonleella jejuensis]|uniref:T9SS type A sorting domain-containing protein n=1 Tax=Hyunsoonleella jejuensis TaxID=419940 RepID=UPI000B806CBF
MLEIKKLSIYNILSQKVFESKTIQNELLLNFLNQGIYILNVEYINGISRTKKIIIQ